MNPDADAMEESAKREIEEFKKEKPILVTKGKKLKPADLSAAWNELQQNVNNGTIYVSANSIKKITYSSLSQSGSSMGVFGGATMAYDTPKDTHHNKGICQESYDQGYEDGLKAAKEGDTRIK